MSSAFLIGAIYAAAAGLSVHREGADRHEHRALHFRGWCVPLLPFVVLLAFLEIFFLIDKLTYAYYIGTPQAFLFWAMPFLALGLVMDLRGRSVTFPLRLFLLVSSFSLWSWSYLNPHLAPLGPEPLLTAIGGGLVLLFGGAFYAVYARRFRFGIGYAILIVLALLLPTIGGGLAPPLPRQNSLFLSLEQNQVTGPAPHYVTNTSEIRVISWSLATAYLHRAYGEAASYLQTDDDTLALYTDPTYLRGRFVWVNVPLFEWLKWLGDRDHAGFVYVENVPENMSREDPGVIHKVERPLDYHMERIEWGKRLHQRLFDRYNDYLLIQTRIDVDEELTPYIVLYLGKTTSTYAVPILEKLVIVDLTNGQEQAFDVSSPAIPSWLEVVYPDSYVYEWTTLWARSRFGWTYTFTNKQHVYEPDDTSARFLVINGTTYWQIPLAQTDSNVLGGYVLVETRTGRATFYNREVKSYADFHTAVTQVSRYLTSGQLGFQHLDIHEGYLYPFKTDDGPLREAYVFPLYAGFSIVKYALLDAQEYTSPPTIADKLDLAVREYSSRSFGVVGGEPVTWVNETIEGAYIGKDPTSSQEEAVITLNGTTYIVTVQQLRGGLLARGDDEWRELNLAAAEYQRTGNVTVWVTYRSGSIVDVDWEPASLVHR